MSKPQTDTAKIEKAMDALLCAIVENEARLAASGSARAIYIVTAAEINEGDVSPKNLDSIIADPVGIACRSEIAALGSLLFETLGAMDKIGQSLERIAGMDPVSINQRRAVLEEACSHVGPEGDVGWK